jgi:putative oxidoreductase
MPTLDSLAHLDGYGLLVARCLVSLVFAASAYDKFRAPPEELAMLNHLRVPFPSLVERGIGCFEVIGTISLITGLYARLMSLLLGFFLCLVTIMVVHFWSEQDPKRSVDRNTFFSNFSIIGGCLYIAIAGPGRLAWAG